MSTDIRLSKRHEHSGFLRWSPDGVFLAIVHKTQKSRSTHIRILDASDASLKLIRSIPVKYSVSRMEWSKQSKKLFAANFDSGILQVFSMADEDWKSDIKEGLAGMSNCFFAPNPRYIITLSSFEIRLTIWDFATNTAKFIEFPKFTDKCIEFSPNDKYLAVAERTGNESNVSDIVSIYTTQEWCRIARIRSKCLDLANLKWSPNNRYLCFIDSPLQYGFFIYGLKGDLVARFNAYEHSLGIKSFSWSPTSQFLAIGSYDQIVRIFNTTSWKCITELKFPSTLDARKGKAFQKTLVIQEVVNLEGESENIEGEGSEDARSLRSSVLSSKSRFNSSRLRASRLRNKIQSARVTKDSGKMQKTNRTEKKKDSKKTHYKIRGLPFKVQDKKPALGPNPKVGISIMAWSNCGRYLACKNDNQDTAIWIWDIYTLSLKTVLHHMNAVKRFLWDPQHLRLAISCQNENFYLWNERGATTVRLVTAQLNIRRMEWKPDGNAIYLADKKHFSVAYPTTQEQENLF